jgi:hypothetical protein
MRVVIWLTCALLWTATASADPACAPAEWCVVHRLPRGVVNAIGGSGPVNLFAVGTSIARFDGGQWRATPSRSEMMFGIGGGGADDLYAVGANEVIQHWDMDHSQWEVEHLPRPGAAPILSVFKRGGDVWALSQRGAWHRSWGVWQPTPRAEVPLPKPPAPPGPDFEVFDAHDGNWVAYEKGGPFYVYFYGRWKEIGRPPERVGQLRAAHVAAGKLYAVFQTSAHPLWVYDAQGWHADQIAGRPSCFHDDGIWIYAAVGPTILRRAIAPQR